MSSERNRSLPDDLRALGLTVAVHNDYHLNDVLHTFWLMTLPNEDGTALAFKGEGVNDADALDQIRAQVKRHFNLEGPSPAPPDIGVGDTLRFMRENVPPPSFPCICDVSGTGLGKFTSVPCPRCFTVYPPGMRVGPPPPGITGDPRRFDIDRLDEILGRQQRAVEWVNSRLGAWSMDPAERARRFLEEAVELAQAAGCPAEDARRTVDYVFARPAGDAAQEVGGARLTLLALAASLKVDAVEAEAAELARVYALPVERFRRRDDEKRAAGICAPAEDPPGTYYPYEGSLPCIEQPPARTWSTTKVTRQPGDRVRVDIDGQVYDFRFVQACDLCENIAAALPAIRWGEGSGLHPGEVVLEQSHPGSRRAAVRPVSGGIALRAVECDGQPAGGSIFLRGGAVDALIAALNAAHIQQGDVLLADLTAAGATRFAPAHLTARRCSSTHLQLLDDGLVTADWWPTTGKARAAGPSGGVAAPHKIFTVDALVEWLKGL